MEFLILLLIIYTLSIPLSNLFKKKIETVIPIVVVGITAIIYIFGLFNNLNLGVEVIEIITLLIAIYNIVFIIKNIKQKTIKESLNRLITPGLCVYITIIFIFIIINHGRIFEDYDEFNHWALIIKNMFMYNQYGTAENSIVNFNEYPPFTATFQYLLVNIKGEYAEDIIIIAQNILYLSMIIPICQTVDFEKKFKNLIVIIPSILLVPLVFYDYFFANILVDALLGILFSIGLFIIYKDDENKIYKNVFLSGIILGLALIKTTGILLAGILILAEFIKSIRDKKEFKNNIKTILIISSIPIILTLSWYIKININNTEREWDFSTLIQENTRNDKEIVKTYVSALFKLAWTTQRGLTVISTILLLGAFSTYLYKTRKKHQDQKEYLYIIIVLGISTFIFYLGLLWMYLKLFTEHETSVLSSFVRYTSTMLLASFSFNVLVLLDTEKMNKSFIYVFLAILFSLLPMETIKSKYINYKDDINSAIVKRQHYSTIKRYEYILNENDKVFFLSNTDVDNVYIYKLCRYEMMGIDLGNSVCYEVESIEKLKQELLNGQYTHLYIFRSDSKFNEEYKELFEDNKVIGDQLYKIYISEEQEIKFLKIM